MSEPNVALPVALQFVPPPLLLVHDLLRLNAESHRDFVPLSVEGEVSMSYAEMDRRSNAVGHGLIDHGVHRGDRVALYFGGMDWVEYAVSYFAVLKAGATATHLTDLLGVEEVQRRLVHAAPVGVIHGGALTPPLGSAGWATTAEGLDTGDHEPLDVEIRSEDIADILYTSGTSGPAKALLNPHGNLSYSYGRGLGAVAKATFASSAPILSPMPVATASSAGMIAIFALTTTSTIMVCPPDDVERMAELIDRHKVGSAMLTPWLAMRMVTDRVHDRHDLSSVTTVGVASAPMPARFATAMLAMMPNATIKTAYGGGSEAVPASIVSIYDPSRPSRVGRPAPGTELRILGPEGHDVPAGDVGEVWLRTNAPKRLYLEKELNESVHVGGWTRSGDLAWTGSDGELYFFDRAIDAIRTGGQLVSTLEVENALYDHPAVNEAAVFGVPEPTLGQAVAAAVVMVPEVCEDPPDLRSWVAGRLAPYKVPGQVQVLNALPRGLSGKVLKRTLRERFAVAAATSMR